MHTPTNQIPIIGMNMRMIQRRGGACLRQVLHLVPDGAIDRDPVPLILSSAEKLSLSRIEDGLNLGTLG